MDSVESNFEYQILFIAQKYCNVFESFDIWVDKPFPTLAYICSFDESFVFLFVFWNVFQIYCIPCRCLGSESVAKISVGRRILKKKATSYDISNDDFLLRTLSICVCVFSSLVTDCVSIVCCAVTYLNILMFIVVFIITIIAIIITFQS